MKIHIFGDSHSECSFNKTTDSRVIRHIYYSITLHRVGRDGKKFIDFKKNNVCDGDYVFYQFGEVDTRCHIGKQLNLGRNLNEIIDDLAIRYINSVKENMIGFKDLKIGFIFIPPPAEKEHYEKIFGPIKHEFPFVGSDSERSNFTILLNNKIKELCEKNNFIFVDCYNFYCDEKGTLKKEISCGVHIAHTRPIIDKINEITNLNIE